MRGSVLQAQLQAWLRPAGPVALAECSTDHCVPHLTCGCPVHTLMQRMQSLTYICWHFAGCVRLCCVQEGKDNKNAWRTRQNASLLLDQINHFFRSGLVSSMEHVLQERDLAVPLHIEAIQKLLAGNTTALNMNFTPF